MPVRKIGTKEACEEWCQFVLGKPISIMGSDGDICVGVVDEVRSTAIR